MSYALTDVQAAMAQYGPRGRAVYALASTTVDTLFPVLYVTFFAGMLYRFRPQQRLWVLALVPVFAGVCDLCESAQIVAMLLQYPDISARQVALASFFTSTKHLLGAVYESMVVVFLAVFLWRRSRRTNRLD